MCILKICYKKILLLVLSLFILSSLFIEGFSYSGQLPEDIYKISQKSFVKVQFFFKRVSIVDELKNDYYDTETFEENMEFLVFNSNISEKKSFDMAGIIISEDGKIVIPEIRFPLKNIKEINVETMTGEKFNADVYGIYLRAPLLVIKINNSKGKKFEPPAFVSPTPLTTQTNLTGVIIEDVFGSWKLSGDKLDTGWTLLEEKPQFVFYTHLPFHIYNINKYDERFVLTPGLLFNESGLPIGIFSTPDIDNDEINCIWKGESLLKGDILQFAELDRLKKEWSNKLKEQILEIKIEFRLASKDSPDYMDSFYNNYSYTGLYDSMNTSKELSLYGVAVDDKRIFIPSMLSAQRVKLIDKISIVLNDKEGDKEESIIEGEFVGVLKNVTGTIIKIKDKDKTFKTYIKQDTDYSLNKGDLYYTCNAQKMFSEKKFLIQYNKYLHRTKGPNNKFYPVPLHFQQDKNFILNSSGDVVGFIVNDRLVDADILTAAKASFKLSGRGYPSDLYSNLNYLYGKEMKSLLADAENNLDKSIVLTSKSEEKRMAWFGVEYENITPNLAKSLDVEKMTRNGRVGLMVSSVYDNSPASKLNIKKNDILLLIKTDQTDVPLELVTFEEHFDYNDEGSGDYPAELKNVGFNIPAKAPWRSQNNYLNNLLDKIGIGNKVELTYIRERKINQTEFIIEYSPRDFESAEKLKSNELGLTVKDLTYEVRKALELKQGDPGIVIAEIEEGTPAAVARLSIFEIITKVNGKEIYNIKDLENFLKDAKDKKLSTIKLQVINLGKSRFADLQVKW